jgi:hypothetical protein
MKIETLKVSGIYEAITSARNPMNSWNLSDSWSSLTNDNEDVIGEKDLGLAQRLVSAGTEHAKFMRMIQVWVNMDMTRFFWSEFDTYKFNSKNSCSTIHKLLNPKNEITLDMFDYYNEDEDIVKIVVQRLNEIRELFLKSNNSNIQFRLKRRAKTLLLEGFLQLRTVNTNYAELRNIVLQRKNHQMKPDWQYYFCSWVTSLPYAKELIFCGIEDEYYRLKESV